MLSSTANSRERSCSSRAIRYTNFARSEPGSACQAVEAARAASTARPTSSGPASAISASGSSVAGEIVVKNRPLFGSTNSPSMNRP